MAKILILIIAKEGLEEGLEEDLEETGVVTATRDLESVPTPVGS